jgi:hypothetical protein
VAEIDTLQDATMENGHFLSSYHEGIFDGLSKVENFLDTIELKEVDFERELGKYVSEGIHRFYPNEGDDYYNMDSVVWQDYVIETAEHFYELGLKAQKGE